MAATRRPSQPRRSSSKKEDDADVVKVVKKEKAAPEESAAPVAGEENLMDTDGEEEDSKSIAKKPTADTKKSTAAKPPAKKSKKEEVSMDESKKPKKTYTKSRAIVANLKTPNAATASASTVSKNTTFDDATALARLPSVEGRGATKSTESPQSKRVKAKKYKAKKEKKKRKLEKEDKTKEETEKSFSEQKVQSTPTEKKKRRKRKRKPSKENEMKEEPKKRKKARIEIESAAGKPEEAASVEAAANALTGTGNPRVEEEIETAEPQGSYNDDEHRRRHLVCENGWSASSDDKDVDGGVEKGSGVNETNGWSADSEDANKANDVEVAPSVALASKDEAKMDASSACTSNATAATADGVDNDPEDPSKKDKSKKNKRRRKRNKKKRTNSEKGQKTKKEESETPKKAGFNDKQISPSTELETEVQHAPNQQLEVVDDPDGEGVGNPHSETIGEEAIEAIADAVKEEVKNEVKKKEEVKVSSQSEVKKMEADTPAAEQTGISNGEAVNSEEGAVKLNEEQTTESSVPVLPEVEKGAPAIDCENGAAYAAILETTAFSAPTDAPASLKPPLQTTTVPKKQEEAKYCEEESGQDMGTDEAAAEDDYNNFDSLNDNEDAASSAIGDVASGTLTNAAASVAGNLEEAASVETAANALTGTGNPCVEEEIENADPLDPWTEAVAENDCDHFRSLYDDVNAWAMSEENESDGGFVPSSSSASHQSTGDRMTASSETDNEEEDTGGSSAEDKRDFAISYNCEKKSWPVVEELLESSNDEDGEDGSNRHKENASPNKTRVCSSSDRKEGSGDTAELFEAPDSLFSPHEEPSSPSASSLPTRRSISFENATKGNKTPGTSRKPSNPYQKQKRPAEQSTVKIDSCQHDGVSSDASSKNHECRLIQKVCVSCPKVSDTEKQQHMQKAKLLKKKQTEENHDDVALVAATTAEGKGYDQIPMVTPHKAANCERPMMPKSNCHKYATPKQCHCQSREAHWNWQRDPGRKLFEDERNTEQAWHNSQNLRTPVEKGGNLQSLSPSWIYVGRMVFVKRRMGPGENSPGGVGRIKKIHTNVGIGVTHVDVKYVASELKPSDTQIPVKYIFDNQNKSGEKSSRRGGGKADFKIRSRLARRGRRGIRHNCKKAATSRNTLHACLAVFEESLLRFDRIWGANDSWEFFSLLVRVSIEIVSESTEEQLPLRFLTKNRDERRKLDYLLTEISLAVNLDKILRFVVKAARGHSHC